MAQPWMFMMKTMMKFKFRKPHSLKLIFGKPKHTGCANSSQYTPNLQQTNIQCCCPLALLLNELHPQNCTSQMLQSETASCKTCNKCAVDSCSAQFETVDCLNDPHTVLLLPYLCYIEQQGNYLKETLSGIEPESPVRFRA